MDLVAVTELRQWAYCPRVVYYHQVMPGVGQSTFKMREGLRAQETIENLELRRTLREYGMEGAERRFGVWLTDEGVGLAGKIDLLLVGAESAAIVDFKLTSGEVGENHRMQLGGYAALVEAAMGVRVDWGFLFRIPDNKVFPVEIGRELRERVVEVVGAVRKLRDSGELPEATSLRMRCVECEYSNFCGDVW